MLNDESICNFDKIAFIVKKKCPATSASRDVLFHTLSHFVWTKFLLGGNTGEIILWTRAQSEEKHFVHVTDQRVDTAWSSIENFAQITYANYLCCDECITTQPIADFSQCFDVLIASFTSDAKSGAKFSFMETCCVSILKYTRQYFFHPGFQPHLCTYGTEETADDAMAPLLESMGKWTTWSQVDLFLFLPLPGTGKCLLPPCNSRELRIVELTE